MTVVAVVLAAALAAVVLAFVGALDRQRRAHARREDLLIAQLLHAAGKTWTPPPAAAEQKPRPEPPRFTAAPEQQPIDP